MGLMERFSTLFGRGESSAFAHSHWGVHPDDHKRPAADAAVRVMPMPARLYVPLVQHIGAPARAVVLVGDRVLKGQRIADPQGLISAAIHAPTSGTVVAVGEIVAPHPSGLSVPAITIEADGRDEWIAGESCADPLTLSADEIGRRVAAAGVVGLGGAAFPAAVKLSGAARSEVATLIINGGECEPYLSCDDRLMRDHAAELVDGIAIVAHAAGAKQTLIGIEDNKPEAIAAMQAAVAESGLGNIVVRPVAARYPMGSEKQMILVLTGREVPANGRPSDVGVLVHNVGTAWAVRDAIRFGRPLVARLITLSGECVAQPGNVEVPIGALCEDVLAFAGGLKARPARFLMGGPMMGLQLPSLAVPVIKGTSGILALSAGEVAERTAGPCIRCGSCLRACPVGLLPLEMNALIGAGSLDGAVKFGLKDCIACGCCAYVCPSRIPLVQAFNHAKGELAAQERSKLRNEATKKMVAARAERVEREAREKAEAAAKRAAERKAQKAREAQEAAAPAAASAPDQATLEGAPL
ncbi:MAG TPA: electron transport complex subunit RsxC [Rhodocyclaceae bacterium]|nr:electron transport complex subunit RsxC [Rhodocyclaceae bacterium]